VAQRASDTRGIALSAKSCPVRRPLGHNPLVTVHGATSHACGFLLGERSLLLQSNDPGPLNFPRSRFFCSSQIFVFPWVFG